MSEDDLRTIRASLCGLLKYYISKGVAQEELHSILGYIAAIGNEEQVGTGCKGQSMAVACQWSAPPA